MSLFSMDTGFFPHHSGVANNPSLDTLAHAGIAAHDGIQVSRYTKSMIWRIMVKIRDVSPGLLYSISL